MKLYSSRRGVIAVFGAAVLTAALTGCSGGAPERAKAGVAGQKPLNFVFVSHSPTSDPFWVVVNNGYKAALAQLGDTGTYRGPQTSTVDVRQQQQQIEQAIASKPDGLIVTNTDPTALSPTIKKAVNAGIPTVVVNLGGADAAKQVGALTYVGSDERRAGVMAAERFKSEGVTTPMVITAQAGLSPAVDDRNAGFQSVYPDAVLVRIPNAQIANATAVTKAVEAALARNTSADAIFSIGSLFNPPMLAARKSVGDRANSMKLGSIDLGDQVVTALKDGSMDFALDQQQWLQGYNPVLILDQYVRYGIAPGSSNVVTGPAFVTKDLLDAYTASIKAGVR